MKWANADGQKILATKGAKGLCPSCSKELIPRCGEIKADHWAHRGGDCDPWGEPETRWHLNWKDLFPADMQEVVMENHRADIKTPHCVVELQYSPISVGEIREREQFYGDMIWVFDCRKQYRNNQIHFQTNFDFKDHGQYVSEMSWSHRKKSILSCTKPVLLHLKRDFLINIYGFEFGGYGFCHNLVYQHFMNEVGDGKINTDQSWIRPPDHKPTPMQKESSYPEDPVFDKYARYEPSEEEITIKPILVHS